MNSPAGALLNTRVDVFDGTAAAATLGTTAPLGGVSCVALQNVVLPFFNFESNQFGKRIATQWWLANLTPASLTAQPAAANRVRCRVITVGVA